MHILNISAPYYSVCTWKTSSTWNLYSWSDINGWLRGLARLDRLTIPCQTRDTHCPVRDWRMGRITHLMVLSWHCSLLSSLSSLGTSSSSDCWLSGAYTSEHTRSKIHTNKSTSFFKVQEEKCTNFSPTAILHLPLSHTNLHWHAATSMHCL